MAHAISTQVLAQTSVKTIIKYVVVSDGASGDLTDYYLFNASTYPLCTTSNGIEYIEYALIGGTAILYWDATANVPIMGLLEHPHFIRMNDAEHSLRSLPNNAAAANRTGDILISTTGFGAAGDVITVIISVFN